MSDSSENLRATTWLVERYGEDVAMYLDVVPVGKLGAVVSRVDESVVKAVEMASEALQATTGTGTTDGSVERRKWLSRLGKALERGMAGEELLQNERELLGEAIGTATDILAGRMGG